MKVLVIEAGNGKCTLVQMKKDAITDLKRTIGVRDRKQAMQAVFEAGTVIKVLRAEEFPFVDADLMLTEDGAYWNLI